MRFCGAWGCRRRALATRHSALFVVTEVRLKYRAAAKLDDEIAVTVCIVRRRRASLTFRQQVLRDDCVLVDGEVTVGVVNAETFAPCRMPVALVDALDVGVGVGDGDGDRR